MKKRFLSLLLCLVMILSLVTAAMPQAKAVDDPAQPAAGESAAKVMGDGTTEPVEPKLNHMYAGTVQFGSFNYTSPIEYRYSYTTKTGGFIGIGATTTTHRGYYKTGAEGADYVVPFVYTDDYFAIPSYSDELASKTLEAKNITITNNTVNASGDVVPQTQTKQKVVRALDWTEIESASLATASIDFTMAAFGSNEENGDTDAAYANYSKNGEEFLHKIGFNKITVSDEYNHFPGANTIGAIIGSKDITVYDKAEGKNKDYTLVAIGIRGGGYGAEWASNLTLGAQGEHQGFHEAAVKVKAALEQHMRANPEQFAEGKNVKYWIVGYSRSGAVANIVAGDMTDAAASYKTTAKDIYCYTFEAAAGADISREPSNTATNYPNIHNILNMLDPVPYVSTADFGNTRLGINYLTPYYDNTDTTSQNTGYYENMHDILETVAQSYGQYAARPEATVQNLLGGQTPDGYQNDLHWSTSEKATDPIIAQAQPGNLADGNYPMDGRVLLHEFDIQEAVTNSAENNLGLLPYEDGYKGSRLISNADGTSGNHYIHIDDFLFQIVNEFFGSGAWDYDPALLKIMSGVTRSYDYDSYADNNIWMIPNQGAAQHRRNYVNVEGSIEQGSQKTGMTPQQAVQYLVGTALGTPGGKLSDLISNFSADMFFNLKGIGQAGGLYLSITGLNGFDNGYGDEDSRTQRRASIAESHLRDLLMTILGQEGGTFYTNSTFTYRVAGSRNASTYHVSDQTAKAVATLVPILGRLFLYDRNMYGSQYLATVLKYGLNTMIVNHVPEVVSSWQMAMDENYISDYRKITLPNNTNVAMYLFRDGIDDSLPKDKVTESIGAKGVKIAEVNGGVFNAAACEDERIKVTPNSNGTFTIFYPGSINYRFDVTTTDNNAVNDVNLTVSDLKPTNGVNVMATYDRSNDTETKGNVIASTRALNYDDMLTPYTTTSANTINTYSTANNITLQPNQTLHIMAWHGSNAPGAEQAPQYAIELTTNKTQLADFGTITVSEDAATGHVYKAESGTFATTDKMGGTNVTYTVKQTSEGNVKSYKAYSTVDVADAAKTNHDDTLYLTDHVSVVPASSVYFDDNLAGQTFTSDGHGYSADIDDAAVSKGATDVSGAFYFTFYGTGIDVYCTTHDEGGYVSAGLFQCDYSATNTLTNRVKEKPNAPITVKNESSTARYNTPTISFSNLEPDTYTVKISANSNAQYKLDGIRVYNPVQAGTAAAAVQEAAGEGNATYLNLRALLLNDNSGFSVDAPDHSNDAVAKDAISGVLYIDGKTDVKTESHWYKDENAEKETWHEQTKPLYTNEFNAYEKNGPKSEIYLSKGESITFQLNTDKVKAGTKVWVGLSAPESGSGTVTITGRTGNVDVTSVMDMYYDFTVQTGGSVTITNTSDDDALISITNLKITGIADLLDVPEEEGNDDGDIGGTGADTTESEGMTSAQILSAKRAVFAPVTMSTIRMAANDGVDPEAVVTEPENPSVPDVPENPDTPDTPDQPDDPTPGGAGSVQEILKQLFESLMKNLFNLFKGLGNW